MTTGRAPRLVLVLALDGDTDAEQRAYGDMIVANLRAQADRGSSSSLWWHAGQLVDVRVVEDDERP